MTLRKKTLENTEEKGENIDIQHFTTVFSTLLKREIIILTSNLLSANAFNLDWGKILSFGKELRHFLHRVP